MGFTIRLGSEIVAAEPGVNTPVTFKIANQGDQAERFEVEIEGIDPEWKAVPVPVATAGPGETIDQQFYVKPARTSESLAGNYPFVVRVRSLVSGEVRTAQGVLEVQPFHHLAMEISPRKGVVSPTRSQNAFEVTVMNLGNADHTLRLAAEDPEDALAYEFEQESVAIRPGQQRQVEVVAVPKTRSFVASARLIGFTVTGRSSDAKAVAASAQAQLEQRSFFSPGSLVVLLLAGLLFAFWVMNRPMPPTIATFTALPHEVEMGGPITLEWSSPDASRVLLYADDLLLSELPKVGTYTYESPAPGETQLETLTFTLVAERNGRRSEPSRATVALKRPEVVADPKILSLKVDKSSIRLGESFILDYRFGPSVTKATLSPDQVELPPALPNLSVTPKAAGTMTYTVTAYNKVGKTVDKTFKVTVADVSDAQVIYFNATPNPAKPDATKVTLAWSVMKAARVLVKADGVPLPIDETASSGSIEVDVTKKTTFSLTAFDERGRRVSQDQVVQFLVPPQPSDPTVEPPPTNPPDGFGPLQGP